MRNLKNIKLISKDSEFFPKKLLDLQDCPEILFVLGNEKILNNFSISIVGTRNSSKLGNDIAFDIAKTLSDNNITIVSGMASGIDTNAHLGALSSTIAIVACGFKHLTSKNFSLVEKILKNNGVIISEYFPDTPPQKFTYLRRNRLVAAISEGLIVVEAPIESGALNTAKTALSLNRPIFAVPWNINISRGRGCNFLIENNAHIFISNNKFLEFFNLYNAPKNTYNINIISNATLSSNQSTNSTSNQIINSNYNQNTNSTSNQIINSNYNQNTISTSNQIINSNYNQNTISTSNQIINSNYNQNTNSTFNNNLNIKFPSTQITLKLPKEFINLYNYIKQNEPITKEFIYSDFHKESISTINSNLILMELQGLIELCRK